MAPEVVLNLFDQVRCQIKSKKHSLHTVCTRPASSRIRSHRRRSAQVHAYPVVLTAVCPYTSCSTHARYAPTHTLVLADAARYQRSVYDKRVDVYSYGVLLWEIFHCKVPYSNLGLGQMSIGKRVMDNDIRPQLGRACPKPIEGDPRILSARARAEPA
eukprot:1190728-Rhodomonas_salina.1